MPFITHHLFHGMELFVSDGATIKAAFSYKTKKWDAEVVGEEKWEKKLSRNRKS
mgnify:CR=1 FL=1